MLSCKKTFIECNEVKTNFDIDVRISQVKIT